MHPVLQFVTSNYTDDEAYQGYFSCDEKAGLGRKISVIDISSQIIKIAVKPLLWTVVGTICVVVGTLLLLLVIPFFACFLIAKLCNAPSKDIFKKWSVLLLKAGGISMGAGVGMVVIIMPVQVIEHIIRLAANIFGISCPEIGRKARATDLISERIIGFFFTPILEMPSADPDLQGKPDELEKKAKEAYSDIDRNLKVGTDINEVKKAANKRYQSDANPNTNAAEFKKVRGAQEFLTKVFTDPNFAWLKDDLVKASANT